MPHPSAPAPLRLLLASGLLLALALGCAGGESVAPTSSAPAPTAAPTAAPAPVPASPTASAASAVGSDGRPLYYDRVLTQADVQGRTLRDFALMRNTIFARAGHPFVKPWLDSYFRAQPWYAPQAKADLTRLSAADGANVAFLADAESRVPRDELVARRAAIGTQGTVTPEDTVELSLISASLGEWSGSADVPVAERNPLEDPTVLANQLTVSQLDGLSRRDLRLLRNTIYARYGRPFKSDVLQGYFADKAWYQALPSYTDGVLTDVDKRNIQLVQSMEDRLGGPMKEWEHQQEEGWFAGA
ncbi:MAG: YARHG domain-containing protein [Pseudomonadota bacterium]|nr:YARHG domain-containing protein [Pseudomonadota bacterium]